MVLPIVLERWFQTWSYGIGHSQLTLLSRAGTDEYDHLVVHFEGTRAMELRSSYRPLILAVAEEPRRSEMIEWAGLPPELCDRFLYLSISSGTPRGYVVCGRMTVFAVPAGSGDPPRELMNAPGSRVLHRLRPGDIARTGQPSP